MFVLYTMHSDSLTDVGTIRVFYLLTYLLTGTGAETSETGQQQRGGIPLIPPPKQPTLAAPLGGLAGLVPGPSSQAAGAKPKSKKVCLALFCTAVSDC